VRLSTLAVRNELRAALWVDGELADLQAIAAELPAAAALTGSVRELLAAGPSAITGLRAVTGHIRSSAQRAAQLRDRGALISAEDAVFAAAIPDPGIVLAAGLNYHAHLREMNTPLPALPYAFHKSVTALIGSGAAIAPPREHDQMVDWEGEFCAVIGRACYNVSAGDALSYVGGYTLINDVSARDWVAGVFASTGIMGPIAAWEENLLGKQFPTFCPLGPAIVTADEIPDPRDVHIQTRLNGTVVQDAHTSDLVFGVAELIAYYSRFHALRPGDVISTGSPSGVGFARDPKVFMRPGDIIEVSSPAIGTLRNYIAPTS
jgi:2-keto-4-pentenoate hydratase/2-oxohepta-3-ene-1,7-dioic acid hydratase in catechol pathway